MDFKEGQEVWVKGVVDSDGNVDFREDGVGLIEFLLYDDLYKLTIRTDDTPTIPKFVAEYIKEYKETNQNIYNLLTEYPPEIGNWLDGNYKERLDTFASAWLDGYEVECEKLYTVEIPNPNETDLIVVLRKWEGCVSIDRCGGSYDWKKDSRFHLTEQEIKQDFEWAWQWAEPVEVE